MSIKAVVSIQRCRMHIGVIMFLFVSVWSVCASENTEKASHRNHEFTLYVMPTLHPLNWESPASLYKSMKSCYLRTIFKKDNYLLGHLAVGLDSPLLTNPMLIAQTSGPFKEKLDLLFKEKVGFAIIGAPLQGRIESQDEIAHKLAVYAKRDKLAFIRFLISEKAAQRMLDFIAEYSTNMNDEYAPSDFYGGAFWPRYHNEGSGCSAFGMALLDVVNLLQEEMSDQWELNLKIPIQLIGGKYNNGKKVKFSTIRKADNWYEGDGELNEDYVLYSVYEPSVMFDWVMQQRADSNSIYQIVDEEGIPGVMIDMSDVEFDSNDSIFLQRKTPNLFIDHYFKKINISSNEPTDSVEMVLDYQ